MNGWAAQTLALLAPRRAALFRHGPAGGGVRPLVAAAAGGGFAAGLFWASRRVLLHFLGVADIGDLLACRLLAMVFAVCFALLLFSAVLTALGRLYLAGDLPLLHALPVPRHRLFGARFLDTVLESSWMVVAFTLPVFAAYGVVFRAGWGYALVTAAAIALLSLIACALGAFAVLAGVYLLPAARLRSAVLAAGGLLFVSLYIAVRLLRPEQLVDPEAFETLFAYVETLRAPSAPALPSSWAAEAVEASLRGKPQAAALPLGLLASLAAALVALLFPAADRFYFDGFSRSQTARERRIRRRRNLPLPGFLPGPAAALAAKEIRSFLRDPGQWTQLFLIAGLLVIYLYNFGVLPLERSPIQTGLLQNLFCFLNLGLALFVLTAVTARFAYPAVSLEREAFWIVRSAPLSIASFLRIKFAIYCLPLLVLTEILIVGTNLLLRVGPFMMALSTLTVLCAVPGIVALGVGLGAAYPDFKAENPGQAVTGFGGLLFMTLAAAFIAAVLALLAGPVHRIVLAGLHGAPLSPGVRLWAAAACGGVLLLGGLAVVLPLSFGARRLARAPL
ncbi:MAG: hypothetical protein WHT06_10030 [Desulfobacterales bacterium]